MIYVAFHLMNVPWRYNEHRKWKNTSKEFLKNDPPDPLFLSLNHGEGGKWIGKQKNLYFKDKHQEWTSTKRPDEAWRIRTLLDTKIKNKKICQNDVITWILIVTLVSHLTNMCVEFPFSLAAGSGNLRTFCPMMRPSLLLTRPGSQQSQPTLCKISSLSDS